MRITASISFGVGFWFAGFGVRTVNLLHGCVFGCAFYFGAQFWYSSPECIFWCAVLVVVCSFGRDMWFWS